MFAALVTCAAGLPTTNSYYYGDPNNGCMPYEMNVSITGLTGDTCSPPCSGQNCPTTGQPGIPASTTGQCVLEVNGATTPTYCVLICDPTNSNSCGPYPSGCQPIQSTGVCLFP